MGSTGTLTPVRRTCERPGCGQPTVLMYGMSQGASGAMTLWIESWNPDQPREVPNDARGALCARHGESLSPPSGWSVDDRRESMPRLFKPKLTAVPDKPTAAKPKRERPKTLPRPRLFDAGDDAAPSSPEARAPRAESTPTPTVIEEKFAEPAPVVVETVVTEPVVEVARVVIDAAPEEGVDDSKSWVPFFDPDDDLGGMLDATGPMLRDAFRSRHNGRTRD